jgi:crotonobetainyl-CoA:carnitine CoA-transferase CaiB-like acyl-CoA transferase
MRGLLSSMGIESEDGFNYYFEQFNRSKRGIAVNLATPDGQAIVCKLVERADVFITSLLEPVRQKLKITYDDLKPVNPRLIYSRGHGQGQRGPEAYDAGFDGISYWARSGPGHMVSPPGGPYSGMPAGAFGDVQGGFALAAGTVAALYRRSVTGKGSLVDVSLLNAGIWAMAASILSSQVLGGDPKTAMPAGAPRNPLTGNYVCGDNRYIALVMLESDRYWPGFCRALGWDNLIDDPRFATFVARGDNREELLRMIVEAFKSRPIAEWVERLRANGCVFSVAQTPYEVLSDPQALANGYFPKHLGGKYVLAASPVQFDNGMVEPRGVAPEPGQHTEEVLLELGYDWDEIIRLKEAGAINC